MALTGIQSKKAALQQSFGTWAPRTPLFDRLFSVDLSTVPISAADAITIVPGVEDFCIMINGVVLTPLADPSTLTQTEFPILLGTLYDQNGGVPTGGPQILPVNATPLRGPMVLAPGFGLSVYGVGVLQAASNYQLGVSFAQVKLVPCDAPPCNQS